LWAKGQLEEKDYLGWKICENELFSAAVSKDCHDVSKLPIMEKLHEEAEKHQRR